MEDKERYKTGERAIAPIAATVIPALVIAVLMVVTAVSSRPKEEIFIDVGRLTEDVPIALDDPPPEPPPPEPDPDPTPDVTVDVDVPEVKIEKLQPRPVERPTERVSGKPAPVDAVRNIRSVVKMSGMPWSNRPGTPGSNRFTDGSDEKYGDPTTEHAVLKALRWLKKTQRTDGSWAGNPISNTGLAVLAYLAHNEKPGKGEFGTTVELALDYLVTAQTGEGDEVRFRGSDGNEYAFLIATYALAEAYGMTRNPNAKAAALKGLGRIVRNQSPTGCLAMQLLGSGDRPEVRSALDYMRAWRPAFDKAKVDVKSPGACPQYYCYYAAQCKYQAGMRPGATPADRQAWQEWNTGMKALYPKTIITPDETVEGPDGKPRQIGYWTNADAHGSGDVMSTCLCALQLMVYYRYLPTTQAGRREVAPREGRPVRAHARDVSVDVEI